MGSTLPCSLRASHYAGFSSYGAKALGMRAQQLQHTGLVALWHMECSQTRNRTHIPRTGRQTLNHWTRKVLVFFIITHRTTLPHCSKVSEQFSPTLYLPCQEPLTGSSWTQAGPQTTQELHCPGMYAAAWLLACKGVVRWGGQNPGGLLSAVHRSVGAIVSDPDTQ